MRDAKRSGEADPAATCKSDLQVHQEGARLVRRNVRCYSLGVVLARKQAVAHAQGEYEQFAAQRRAELKAEGEAYVVRMPGTGSTEEKSIGELGQLAKRPPKNKGGHDAS